MELDVILLVIEILGIISFSISGSIVAIDKGMDVFGVVLLGVVTSFGGGIMRDLIIGNVPPLFFGKIIHLVAVSVFTAILVFAFAYAFKRWYVKEEAKIIIVNNYIDAVGLGAFAVSGVKICLSVCEGGGAFLAICMGVITAVGGGVLRDVCLGDVPFILRKRIYALAAIVGASLYYLIDVVVLPDGVIGDIVGSVVGVAAVVLIRVLATHFKWNLPKVQFDENDN